MNALEKIRAGYALYPQLCMDFLEEQGFCVEALGNEEILQLTEELLNEMDQEDT
jgi:hypothetical protein